MNITLYNNLSDNNVLTKNINALGIKSCTFKEDESVLNPTILLNSDGIDVNKANYCYINELERYYYIENIVLERGSVVRLRCSVDVLMSHKAEILKSEALINTAENFENKYMLSPVWRNEVREFVSNLNFDKGFNEDPQFVLITAGATI